MGNGYSGDQLMHILDNINNGEKCIAQIASHQSELIREENVTNQKYLSVTSLQVDYLNIYSSSGSHRNNERENLL